MSHKTTIESVQDFLSDLKGFEVICTCGFSSGVIPLDQAEAEMRHHQWAVMMGVDDE
jgi:hypothetical protein